MKNISKIARYITQHGTNDIMIHTIPETTNWVICQKIENDKWQLTLANPMGETIYNLGTVNNQQHLILWDQITKMQIEKNVSRIAIKNEFKETIKNFNKNYENTYAKFTKRELNELRKPIQKTKRNRKTKRNIKTKNSRRTKRNIQKPKT